MSYEIQAGIGSHLTDIGSGASELQRIAASMADSVVGHDANATGGFGADMLGALHGVNEQDRLATEKMADVDSGRSDDLVGAMLASQEASLSFSMLMQVRNKVMGAVEELIKLPL